mmetsp:Transcript_13067/g.55701  ORF Transcript_13067/g.55701 Transcript_13067/m.55701 type:complete len:228 (-) Transcript_13067:275-958(-)
MIAFAPASTAQLPLMPFLRSFASSSSSPPGKSTPSSAARRRLRISASFIFRSWSKMRLSSRHSRSNKTASRSPCARSAAISLCAWSLASYAMLEISITSLISRFFAARSRSIFLYTWSKFTRSTRSTSISARMFLFRASASLNCVSVLSSLFSNTRTCFSICWSPSLAASAPPSARRCSTIFASESARCWSSSSTRRRSISILRVYKSAKSPRRMISACACGPGALF